MRQKKETRGSNENKIAVKVPLDMAKGVYSNAARIHIRNSEVVVDFVYDLPDDTDMKTLEVVSRINMSFESAEKFLSVFQNAILDHRNMDKK